MSNESVSESISEDIDANLAEATAKSLSIANSTQIHQTTTTVEHTWTIKNFSFHTATNSRMLYSGPFSLGHGYPLFRILLGPKGHSYSGKRHKKNSNYISLLLQCTDKPTTELLVSYQFSIINKDGQHVNRQEQVSTFTSATEYGFLEFIRRSTVLNKKNGLLSDDQFKIHCKVTVSFEQSSAILSDISNVTLEKRSQRLNKLLDTGHHSDVILSVDGVEIPAHKAILSARSFVFERMFDHRDFKEAQEGRVIIEDVDVDTFKVLLKYLYSGQIPEKEQLTEELLVVSNKYLISDLNKACQEHLSTTLTIASAARLYHFADIHNAATLKVNCLHYILANTAKVMATKGWKAMLKISPELVDSILGHVVQLLEQFKKMNA